MRAYLVDMVFAMFCSFSLLLVIFYSEVKTRQLMAIEDLLKRELLSETVMKELLQKTFENKTRLENFDCVWNTSEAVTCKFLTVNEEELSFVYENYLLLFDDGKTKIVKVSVVYGDE